MSLRKDRKHGGCEGENVSYHYFLFFSQCALQKHFLSHSQD